MTEAPDESTPSGAVTPVEESDAPAAVAEPFESPTRRDFLPTAFAVQFGIVVLAVFLGWVLGERFWERTAFTPQAVAWGVAATVPLVLLVVGISESGLTWGPFRTLERDFEKIVLLFRKCTVADLLLVSILAGVGEEFLFRGVIQGYAENFMGPWTAVLIASAIFGLLHAISVSYIVGVFIIGLYLGALYVWFDNLAVPIIVHGLYDFAALVYATKLRR